MAKKCIITGKQANRAGKYSNKTRATVFTPCGNRWQRPNVQKKKIYVPELDTHVKIPVSAKGLKTIQKNGAYATLKKAGVVE